MKARRDCCLGKHNQKDSNCRSVGAYVLRAGLPQGIHQHAGAQVHGDPCNMSYGTRCIRLWCFETRMGLTKSIELAWAPDFEQTFKGLAYSMISKEQSADGAATPPHRVDERSSFRIRDPDINIICVQQYRQPTGIEQHALPAFTLRLFFLSRPIPLLYARRGHLARLTSLGYPPSVGDVRCWANYCFHLHIAAAPDRHICATLHGGAAP